MMKNKVLNDERLSSESNKIYKICFHILCLCLLIDVIYKFYYHNVLVGIRNGLWINYVIELIVLVVFLYLSLFIHAYKGIVVYAVDLPNNKFQLKRSLKVSLTVSAFVSIITFIIPIIIKGIIEDFQDMPFINVFLIFLLLAIGCSCILLRYQAKPNISELSFQSRVPFPHRLLIFFAILAYECLATYIVNVNSSN